MLTARHQEYNSVGDMDRNKLFEKTVKEASRKHDWDILKLCCFIIGIEI